MAQSLIPPRHVHSPSSLLAHGVFPLLCGRRPSSWLSPSAHILAVMVKGLAAEKIHAQEQPERNTPNLPQPHREVRALCDHTGAADGHLSFQKGDILQLLATVDEDWICCCHGNSTGLVPVGYTSLIL
ncbi:AP-4 complex accessory subunit RUSC1-like [Cygnus atratus]|uniref:AP-4 complex accessory subunit RUSC1-like n=1 Tax=Cygnus atratus TaxID=8868 RepID=UPI0021B70437|nr:AP-4 complex accessory subunit RUSC1-like [Cygnus atratus]